MCQRARTRRIPFLTAAQTTVFFEDVALMGISNATGVQLQAEGIASVDNLVDFDKDTIKQVTANLQRSAGWVTDPNPAAVAGATVPTPPFIFGAVAATTD
jgi:hypothetical protein